MPVNRIAGNGRAAPPPARGKAPAGPVLGGLTVGQVLAGFNWANAAAFVSPLAPAAPAAAAPRVTGALPLREFLAGVNWRNTPGGGTIRPPAPDPDRCPPAVDNFFADVIWD